MIRSCPNRLEFKNECYSTVNQSISKKTSIFAWVNNFPQKCQFKSFDQWKLTLIFSPYKPELSMIRSCPNRLEFKNECYSTVNQKLFTHLVKRYSVFLYFQIDWDKEKIYFNARDLSCLFSYLRLNRFGSEKRCRNSTFTFGPPKSVLPSSF
jgi:hypothetical protein